MKKILVLGTGGTISCSSQQREGKSPVYSVEEILEHVPGMGNMADIVCDTPIRNQHGNSVYIDSTNMQPEYMAQVADRIYRGYKEGGIDGAVVLGGTDTMEESGADLTFMLPYKKIPVVLTGSMMPPDNPRTDADSNVRNAVQFAAEGIPGTYIVFGKRVIPAARAKKIHPSHIDAFRSINHPQIGRYDNGTFLPNKRGILAVRGAAERFDNRDMELMNRFSLRTHLLELYCVIRPALLDHFFDSGYLGIIIEAFGTGGIPNDPHYMDFTRKIERWTPRRLVGITSKAFSGQATGEYEVSTTAFEAGATSLADMLPSTAISKANWLFGYKGARDIDDVKQLMLFPVETEIKAGSTKDDMKLFLDISC